MMTSMHKNQQQPQQPQQPPIINIEMPDAPKGGGCFIDGTNVVVKDNDKTKVGYKFYWFLTFYFNYIRLFQSSN